MAAVFGHEPEKDTLSIRESLYQFRHDLHRHPELSGKELRTAGKIRGELEKCGLPWRAVGGTGTLAELKGRQPGPVILLRADIDALPITEVSRFPFPSENEGVMHACGHDVHAAALLGAAKVLTKYREHLAGSVRFVFQQAEETGKGSRYFLDAGAAESASCIYGFHVSPDAPLGTAILTSGVDAASCGSMFIRIYGKGAHIAKPHIGRDASLAAADIALHLANISSGFDPLENILIGIGRIHSGNTWNVISDYAEIEGTVRTLSMSAREELVRMADDIIHKVAEIHGVTVETEFELHTPCLINDREAYQTMYGAALEVLGNKNKIINKPVPFGFAADDFAAFSERMPGCFIHVGTALKDNPDTSVPLHSANLLIDDRAIDIGCELLVRCALSHLGIKE